MNRFKKQKEQSYWSTMDGLEKFIVLFLISTIGFYIHMLIK